MQWLAGEDEQLESEDESEPGYMQHAVTRALTIDDDRRPFRCVTALGDLQQHCEIIVKVPRESCSLVMPRVFICRVRLSI